MADVKDLCSPVIAAGHQQVAVDRVHMTCCHLQHHTASLMLPVANLTHGCIPRSVYLSARHEERRNLTGNVSLFLQECMQKNLQECQYDSWEKFKSYLHACSSPG